MALVPGVISIQFREYFFDLEGCVGGEGVLVSQIQSHNGSHQCHIFLSSAILTVVIQIF